MSKIKFSKIKEILQDAKRGKMFILLDDEGRENEGDLIIPASNQQQSRLILWQNTVGDLYVWL